MPQNPEDTQHTPERALLVSMFLNMMKTWGVAEFITRDIKRDSTCLIGVQHPLWDGVETCTRRKSDFLTNMVHRTRHLLKPSWGVVENL